MTKRVATSEEHRSTAVRSIHGGRFQYASRRRILEVVGGATGHLPERQRPNDAERRAAVAIAAAMSEYSLAFGGGGAVSPRELKALAGSAGLTLGDATKGFDLLLRVGAADAGQDGRVRLSEHVVEDLPVLAGLDFEAIRGALRAASASAGPALAILREIAARSGAADPTAEWPWIDVRLSDLADATLFRRTAVTRAVADLERVGALERSSREGREASLRLGPVARGDVDRGAVALAATPAPSLVAPLSDRGPQAAVSTSPAPSTAGTTVASVGGRTVEVAAGVPVHVSVDPDGACRLTAGALTLVVPAGAESLEVRMR